MKSRIVILLLLCSEIGLSQDYTRYYEGISKAKTALVHDSLQPAIETYFNTFAAFEFVFARDCYNALEVSCRAGNNQMTSCFLKRCLQQGVAFELLEQDTLLAGFKQTAYWPGIVAAKDSLSAIYKKSVNWKLRTAINSMFAEDQQIRDLANKYRFNVFKIRKLNKQFEAIDERLVRRLVEITKEYGFPGEQLIGLDTDSMHPKIRTANLSAGMPIVILIHHYSQPNSSYNPLLKNEIAKGNLANEHYAVICDFQNAYGKKHAEKVPAYTRRFNTADSPGQLNTRRKEIGLLSIETMQALESVKIITPFWKRLY